MTTFYIILPSIKIYWPIIIPIGVFVLMFSIWLKKGREPVLPEIIIPYSDIPDDLTPIEVGYMINNHVRKRDISAELIYLAEKGYLKIKKLGKKRIELLQYVEHDYELTLLKEIGTLSNSFDKEIMRLIFGSSNAEVGKVANLASSMIFRYRGDGSNLVLNLVPRKNLLKKEYYSQMSLMGIGKESTLIIVFIFSLASLITFLISISRGIVVDNSLVTYYSLFLAVDIFFAFDYFSSSKTMKGSLAKEHILGFKNYIQDKNNKTDILGRFLSYAIMLEVDVNLIKESVGVTTPNWYEGDNLDFTSEILLFNSIVSDAVY